MMASTYCFLSSPSSSPSSSSSTPKEYSIIESLIGDLIKLIEPEYLRKCIEYNIYIFQSIAYALTDKSPEELRQELIKQYNIQDEHMLNTLLHKSLYLKRLGRVIFRMIHNVLRQLPINYDEKLTLENLEKLFRSHYPELYSVYLEYGEQGKRWLQNEIEYDLKPFIAGKKRL